MPRNLIGIRRRRGGWRVTVRVRGHLYTKQFPLDTPIAELRAWREQQIATYGGRRGAGGSLRADVERFLAKPAIAAQKYVRHVRAYLALWVTALGGDRPRLALTRDDIEAVLQQWLKTCAEPTVYHRRSALLQLFTVLDGAGAANPVKDTTCPRSWIAADHSVPFTTLQTIVAAMPDARYATRGIRQPSVAKLVAAIIIAVGLRAVDLLKVRPRDVDLDAAEFLWPASEKGKGVAAKRTPLSAEGVAAFRAYLTAGAPRFTPSAVSHSFKRAARRIDGADTPIHLYSLRHSIGADAYRETGDLATVGRLLNHAPGSRATAQYAQGANAAVDRAAVAALSAARTVHADPKRLPGKLPAATKRRAVKQLRRRA